MASKNENDYKNIMTFIKKSKLIIGDIVDNPMVFLRKEFYEDAEIMTLMRKAWVRVVDSLELTVNNIRETWTSKKVQDKLEESGLSGEQLEFKIGVFEKFYERFIHQKGNWFLKELLSIINAILDSLKSAFPPLEGLSEFKKMIEPMIKTFYILEVSEG